MGGRKTNIAAIIIVILAAGILLATPRSSKDTRPNHPPQQTAVLSETTKKFEKDLQACLDYNQALYEHDKAKIERGSGSPNSNPKDARLKDLAEWYVFEQNACRDFYENQLKTWNEQHN